MKKLIFIILFFVPFLVNAQTSITTDVVKTYSYADTLAKDEAVSVTYYVKDFATDVRLQLQADSLTTGYTKVTGIVYGSLDYVNWFSLGDTITLASTDADSDKTLYSNVFYNYIKVTVTAIDSVQYTDFDYKLLINTNE